MFWNEHGARHRLSFDALRLDVARACSGSCAMPAMQAGDRGEHPAKYSGSGDRDARHDEPWRDVVVVVADFGVQGVLDRFTQIAPKCCSP